MRRNIVEFLKKYVYAAISCLYLFTVGCFFSKNRFFLYTICNWFGYPRKSTKVASLPGTLSPKVGTNKSLLEELENHQFIRYVMYRDIIEFVSREFHAKQPDDPKIIEFGGSNHFIKKVFNHPHYEIAENYPKVDLQNLSNFNSTHYDFIILDQVLEHVTNPRKVLHEVHRVLKKGGWLINTTPFLVQIHFCPNEFGDYWRFSREGMRQLLSDFSEVIVKSWGNKETAVFHLRIGTWPSTQEIKKLGLFNLENEEDSPYVIWSYSKK